MFLLSIFCSRNFTTVASQTPTHMQTTATLNGNWQAGGLVDCLVVCITDGNQLFLLMLADER